MKKKLIVGIIVILFLCVIVSIATRKPARQAVTVTTGTPPAATTLTTPTSQPTTTPIPIGLSRLNPAPIGQAVVADNDIELTVLRLEREAWPKIHEANMFNKEPGEGMEYVIVAMRVNYLGNPDTTKGVSSWDFRTVGDKGAIYQSASVVLTSPLAAELFGGGTTEGELAFEVALDETGLVLIYDSGLDTDARYLSLGR